jgi:chaperonin GroES
MEIKPLGDRVLIKPVKEEDITSFGLVLPDTIDKDKKMEGIVTAIGPGKMLDSGERTKMTVSPGDTVLFKSWGGDIVEFESQIYKIIAQEDILAIINN